MKKLVLLLAMLVVSVPCFAADEDMLLWKFETGNVYVIPDSFEQSGIAKFLWLEFVYNADGKKQFDKKDRNKVNLSKSKYKVICGDKRLTREAFVLFDKSGNVLSQDIRPDTEIVVPGTFGDNLYKLLCRKTDNGAAEKDPIHD